MIYAHFFSSQISSFPRSRPPHTLTDLLKALSHFGRSPLSRAVHMCLFVHNCCHMECMLSRVVIRTTVTSIRSIMHARSNVERRAASISIQSVEDADVPEIVASVMQHLMETSRSECNMYCDAGSVAQKVVGGHSASCRKEEGCEQGKEGEQGRIIFKNLIKGLRLNYKHCIIG